MRKRLISIAVVLSIVASLFTFNMYSSAESTNLSPNMAILENILYGDRQFVIDTLIGTNFKTDFSTNPHALVNYIGDESTMMDNVLSQYQNENDPNYSAAYKVAVDIMEKVYNGDNYIQHAADWVTSFGADLASIFSNDAQRVMDDLTYSVAELQYESILKEALAADYTSSNGTELSTTELELENLKRLSDAVSCLKAFQSFALSYGKANHYDEKDENFRNAYDYYTKYLTSYSDSIEKALGSFSKVMNLGDTEDVASFIALMGTVAQYDLHCAELEAFDSEIPQYAAEYFVSSEDLEKMKFDKSVISGVDNALSAYMFINSIALQRDAIGDTLTRMSNTANPYLKPILIKFANEVGKAGDAKLMGYESLMKVLRDENATVDFAKWGTKKLSEKSSIIKSFKKKALTDTALSKAISGATNVVNISSWCADKTMSFGDTCKKTYELKYLRTLIAQAIVTYEDDLEVYLADKTEENARIVLDDLLMIQKLRLRGETIAYKMTEGQWGSPLGRLLANGTLSEDKMLMDYLTQSYQSRVDAFIGASAMPFTTDSLTIKNGESLTIDYSSSYGGFYGRYRNSSGKTYGIGELKYKIANGLTVNSGGQIFVMQNEASAYMPYVINSGGSVILGGNSTLAELTQSSGTTQLGANTYQIDTLYLSGGSVQTEKSGTINTEKLNISGTVTANLPITCTNNMNLSGTLKGNTVYLKGNSTGSGTLDNLVVSGSGTQNLSGTINTTNLTYTNTGTANQTGTINVSGSVQNTSSKVTSGQNTVLKSTGSIVGSHYNSGLTIDGITLDSAMTFGGTLKTLNTINLNDVSIAGGLTQSSGTLNLNGDVTVTSDSYFGGTVTQKENTYYSGGDITVNSTNTFKSIITKGKVQQNISGTLNTANFTNTNPKGIKVSNAVNVSGTLTNTYGKITGIGMTLLSGGKFGSNTYQGDVTIQSTCDLPSKLTGNVALVVTNTINQDTDIGGYLTVNGGALTLTEAELDVGKYLIVNNDSLILNNSDLNVSEYLTLSKGSLKLSASELNSKGKITLSVPLTADDKSFISCNSVFENNSTMTGNDTPVTVKDMVHNKGTINNCLVTVKEFINLGTVSGGNVVAISDIYNGDKMNVDSITVTPSPLAEITGNDITTKYFSLSGSGKISLRTKINVTEGYTNEGVTIDDSKIILSPDRVITTDKAYSTLNQIADLIIDGATVTVDTLTTTAGIKLTNGAKLIVNKSLTASGNSSVIEVNGSSYLTVKSSANIAANLIIDDSTVTVDSLTTTAGIELSNGAIMSVNKNLNAGASSKQVKIGETASLLIKKIASFASYSDISVNGELTLGSDAVMNSTKLSGSGTINIKGDLFGESLTVNKPENVNIIGKTPQIISCSNANFNNLSLLNTSRTGVTFSSSVNCYGEYNKNGSNVSGTVTQK